MAKAKILALTIVAALAASPAFAGGDVKKGAKVFKKCKSCHTLKAGKHKSGPSLAGVIGRKAGSVDGYKKYKGLKGADFAWDEANLDKFLTNPKKFLGKKSSMTMKLKKAKDRANVIAYLKSL